MCQIECQVGSLNETDVFFVPYATQYFWGFRQTRFPRSVTLTGPPTSRTKAHASCRQFEQHGFLIENEACGIPLKYPKMAIEIWKVTIGKNGPDFKESIMSADDMGVSQIVKAWNTLPKIRCL